MTNAKKFCVSANAVHSFEKSTLLMYRRRFEVRPMTTSLLLTRAVCILIMGYYKLKSSVSSKALGSLRSKVIFLRDLSVI